MARLAAQMNGEFYPTPPNITQLIAHHIASLPDSSSSFVRLFDPCAGEGVALQDLRILLQENTSTEIQAWGNEIHPGRAAAAETRLDKVVNSPVESIAWKPAHGIASLLFLNPPYDYSEEEDYKRMEAFFLNRTSQALVPGGLLVFIVPVKGMTWRVAERLVQAYEHVHIYRFPDEEFEIFKQVVVFGIRKHELKANGYVDYHESQKLRLEYEKLDAIKAQLPVLGNPVDDFRYPVKLINSRAADLYRYGWNDEEVIDSLSPPELPHKQLGGGPIEVLVKPKPGMMANIMAGSNSGTMVFPGELIKGATVKSESVETEETNQGTNTITRTQWSAHIVRVTNEHGLEYYQEKEALPFLKDNVNRISEMLSKQMLPYGEVATPEEITLINSMSIERPWPNGHGSGLYPDQKDTVIAGLRALERYHVFNCIAEMGYGKTTVGAALIGIRNQYPVLIVAPRHLLKKWQREIPEVVKDAVPVIVDTVGELQAQVQQQSCAPDRKLVILVANTMIAYGPGWEKTAAYRYTLPRQPESRTGFRTAMKEYTAARQAGASAKNLEALRHKALQQAIHYPVCPVCGKFLDFQEALKGKGPHHCPNVMTAETEKVFVDGQAESKTITTRCNAPLYQYQDTKARRWPLAQYIKDHLSGWFNLLIVDEVHQYKSSDSLRGSAYGKLSDAIGDTVNLTGTFYGGKASSIFYLLYRSQPWMRAEWSYEDEQRWVETYGRIETTYKEKTTTSEYNAVTTTSKSMKEIPGASPQMMEWILRTSAFKSVRDLGVALPPFEDHVIRLDMTPAQAVQYSDMEATLWALVLEDWRRLSTWFQWCLSRPNSGFRDEVVDYTDDFGVNNVITTLDALVDASHPKDLLPKEQWLVDFCQDEIKHKRKVVIFVRQTGTRDIRQRLVSILRTQGITAQLLPDTISAENREAWINQHAPQIFITNPRRVETGLDLVMYSSFVFYGLEYSLYTLWQASMRLHRPGQLKKVKGYYLVYNGTMEDRGINLIGAKMAAGKQLYGDDVSGALVENTDSGTFVQELYKQMKENGQMEVATSILGSFESAYVGKDEIIQDLIPEEIPAQSDFPAGAGVDYGFMPGKGDAYNYIPAWMTIPKLYTQENIPTDEQIVYIKLFTPDSDKTYYLTEYSDVAPDGAEELAFGLTDDGWGGAEFGYFSIPEMKKARGGHGLPVERDLWFKPCTVKEVKALIKGESIAEERRIEMFANQLPGVGDEIWYKINGETKTGTIIRMDPCPDAEDKYTFTVSGLAPGGVPLGRVLHLKRDDFDCNASITIEEPIADKIKIGDQVWWKNGLWIKTGIVQSIAEDGRSTIELASTAVGMDVVSLLSTEIHRGTPPAGERPTIADLYQQKADRIKSRKRKAVPALAGQLSMFDPVTPSPVAVVQSGLFG